jgi:hypothetical protein
MPDPADARKRYEQELKEQMDAKKRVDDENKRKEREEEDKLERRLQEQQEKMKREFDEEMNKKKAKEEAVSNLSHKNNFCKVEYSETKATRGVDKAPS